MTFDSHKSANLLRCPSSIACDYHLSFAFDFRIEVRHQNDGSFRFPREWNRVRQCQHNFRGYFDGSDVLETKRLTSAGIE